MTIEVDLGSFEDAPFFAMILQLEPTMSPGAILWRQQVGGTVCHQAERYGVLILLPNLYVWEMDPLTDVYNVRPLPGETLWRTSTTCVEHSMT